MDKALITCWKTFIVQSIWIQHVQLLMVAAEELQTIGHTRGVGTGPADPATAGPKFCAHQDSIQLIISYISRAGRNGLAAPVLAGSIFLKVKTELYFYKKQVINKSASVISGLVRLFK